MPFGFKPKAVLIKYTHHNEDLYYHPLVDNDQKELATRQIN